MHEKTLAGENIGEFGELLANRQSFVPFGGQIIKILSHKTALHQ